MMVKPAATAPRRSHRKIWMAAAFSLICAVAPAQESGPAVKTLASIKGTCESLVIAGQQKPCSPVSAVAYALMQNGKELLSIAPDSKTILSFVSEKDSQPDANDFFMYLDHIDIRTNAAVTTVNVGGECQVKLSTDGMIWHEISCQSQDANGAAYNFIFASDVPVDMKQF